jgi:hypothetical protein
MRFLYVVVYILLKHLSEMLGVSKEERRRKKRGCLESNNNMSHTTLLAEIIKELEELRDNLPQV